jgi:predicted nucleic acid-binding protein
MRAFFDTNVIVYAYDANAGSKRERAIALIEAHVRAATLVLSTQVLVEAYNVFLRATLLEKDAALAVVEDLAEESVVATDAALVLRALHLAQRQRLSHWDGLIVQAAMDARCSVLFSEDLQAGTRYGELEVVNPFADTAREAPSKHAAGQRAAPVRKARRK